MKKYEKFIFLISVFILFINITNGIAISTNEKSHSMVKHLPKRQAEQEIVGEITEPSNDDSVIEETIDSNLNTDDPKISEMLDVEETTTEESSVEDTSVGNTSVQVIEKENNNGENQNTANTTEELLKEETTTEEIIKAEDPVDHEDTTPATTDTKVEEETSSADSTTTAENTNETTSNTEEQTTINAAQLDNVNDDQNNKDFDQDGMNAVADEITKEEVISILSRTEKTTIGTHETSSTDSKEHEHTKDRTFHETTVTIPTLNEVEVTEDSTTITTTTTTKSSTTESSTMTFGPTITSSRRSKVYFKPKSLIFHLNDTITDEIFIIKHCPSLTCEFGFRTDLNGKPLCDCFNPCYEKKCGNKVCVIKRNSETDFEPECYDPVNLERPPKCYMPLAPGNCKDYTSRYFYNPFKKECMHFIYTGCNGNANNFPDWETCQMECNACSLPPQKGPCHAKILRYYYDSSKRQCSGFEWGGCKGNENNFASRIHCEESCKDRKKGSLFLNGMKKTYINEYHRKSNNRP